MRDDKAVGRIRAPWRSAGQAVALAAALALTGSAWATKSSASFAVTVNLRTSADSGTCLTTPDSPSQPAVVTIDCHNTKPVDPVALPAAPAPRRDARAYRFLIPDGQGDLRYGGVDLYAGAGTITSWRVVHLTDWDYLEMTVGW